jgi:hypothetical protein
MLFGDVYLVSNKRQTIPQAQIADLQRSLGIMLPEGYAQFMTILGIGDYCGLLMVYEPEQVLQENRNAPWYGQLYFHWKDEQDVLPKEEVLKCLIFARTNVGDSLIFHADIPDRLFVLPRDDDTIYWVPDSFFDPLEWYSKDGLVDDRPSFKWFESYRDRKCVTFDTSLRTLRLSDVAMAVSEWWPDSEVHILEGGDEEARVVTVFVKAIGGNLQFYQDVDDPRVDIRIDYDGDSGSEIDRLADKLKTLGFYRSS